MQSLYSFIVKNHGIQCEFVNCIIHIIQYYIKGNEEKVLWILDSKPDINDNFGHDMNDPLTLFVLAFYYAIIRDMIDNNIFYKRALEIIEPKELFNLAFYFVNLQKRLIKLHKNHSCENNYYYNYAETFLLKACDKNYLPAYYSIGKFYYMVKKNYTGAILFFEKGIEQKCGRSAYELGNLYYKKYKNYEKAKKYHELAIRYGNREAYAMLGLYYWVIEKNIPKMKRILQNGYKKGCPYALEYLATYYCNDEKNYNEAKKIITDGVNSGHSELLCVLGDFYKNIERNNFEANKHYLMAVIKNYKEGLIKLEKNSTAKELFLGLYIVGKKNEMIINKIEAMKNRLTIRALYENLVRNEENIKECPECGRTDVVHLQFDCRHEVCRYCFIDMTACPYRCFIHTNRYRKYHTNKTD
jgi:tetratricopeptide (TPR) repeat protein